MLKRLNQDNSSIEGPEDWLFKVARRIIKGREAFYETMCHLNANNCPLYCSLAAITSPPFFILKAAQMFSKLDQLREHVIKDFANFKQIFIYFF